MSEQTAVEWLVHQFIDYNLFESGKSIPIDKWEEIRGVIKQARQMEKEQIVNAVDGFPLNNRNLEGEQYYEQTYGGNK
jgi:hypothetical protein